MKLLSVSACALIALGLSAAGVRADEATFKSPTGNINCLYSDFDAKPEVRCDILQFVPSFKTVPAGASNEVMACTPARLHGFTVTPTGLKGAAFCPTDAVVDMDAIVLAYGNSWSRSGITCKSETSGMTCANAAGHGFFLSKAQQKVF